MKTKLTFLLLAAATLLPTIFAQATSNIPAVLAEKYRVERFVEPVYPATFYNQGVSEGYVQAHLLLAADGTLLETFMSAYSRPEFANAVQYALSSWKFRPAADPSALPKRFSLRFDFHREGMIVVQGNFSETVDNFLGHKDHSEVTLCKLRDLDSTPDVLNLVVPVYPPELLAQNISGGVAVSFFIDETGAVRAVATGDATHPEFAAAALAAVRQWTFTPPQRKGHPTRVLAVQEFNFAPGRGVTEGPATP